MNQQLAFCLGPALSSVMSTAGNSRAVREWPQFRGPQADGHADSTKIPLNWRETENVAWKTEVPGTGHSSPVISGDHIWVTSAVEVKLSEVAEKDRLAAIKNFRGLEIAGSVSLRTIGFL